MIQKNMIYHKNEFVCILALSCYLQIRFPFSMPVSGETAPQPKKILFIFMNSLFIFMNSLFIFMNSTFLHANVSIRRFVFLRFQGDKGCNV